ncbi:hypothetical protein [Sphingobium olei]|uniref:Uncharacterized protein n=1 Tax=Sphingobium olei TaxID=420955 RepID=A0ABW3NV03_9SPHN
MLNIFKRKEPVISLAEHERIVARLEAEKTSIFSKYADAYAELAPLKERVARQDAGRLKAVIASAEARRGKKRETELV